MAKRTYDVVQPLYGFTVADDCPLVVERGNFLRESGTNAVFLQLKLVNYGSEPIKTATLEGTVIDETGDPLPNGSFAMTYAEVNCEMLAAFGTKQLVPVIDVGRYALITRLEVEFASGFVQSWQGDFAHCCLRSRKVTVPEPFRGAVGAVNKVLIEPAAVGATMHRCCCGALLGNSIPCPNCGRTADQAMYAVTRDGMEEALRKSGARTRPAQNTAQSAAPQGKSITGTMSAADLLLSSFRGGGKMDRRTKVLSVAGAVGLAVILVMLVIGVIENQLLTGIEIGVLYAIPIVAVVVLFMLREQPVAVAFLVVLTHNNLIEFIAALLLVMYYIKRDLQVEETYKVRRREKLQQWYILLAVVITTPFVTGLLLDWYYDHFGVGPSKGYIPAVLIMLLVNSIPVTILFLKNTKHKWAILACAIVLTPVLCWFRGEDISLYILSWAAYKDVYDTWKSNLAIADIYTGDTGRTGVGVTRGGKDTLAGLKLGGKLGTTGLVVGVGAAIVVALVLFGRQLDDFWYDLTGGWIMAKGLGVLGLVLVVLYFIPVVILFLKNATHKWQITAGAAVALAVFVFVIPNALLAVIAWLVVCWLCFAERRSYTLKDNNDITINIDRK